MPATIDTDDFNGAPHSTDCQQGWHILVDILAIAELVDSRNLAGFVHRRFVLHANLCLELVLGGKVEMVVQFIVDADDGGYANTRLVA